MVADAYQIFARARQYWEAQQYPRAVDYTIHVSAREDSSLLERHYHARWDAQTDSVILDPVSDEERAHPYHPAGGFSFYGMSIGGPREGSGTHGDLIGLPLSTPNYSFGVAPYTPPADLSPAQLVAQIRREYHDPAPQKIAELEAKYGLKTIAALTSISSEYTVSLLGTQPYGGHQDYHLQLTPVREPQRYRLREVWIDSDDYAVDKLVSAANFTDGRTSAVPWTVTFVHEGGVTYIASETANGAVAAPYGKQYDDYTISIEDVHAPSGHMFAPQIGGTVLQEPAQ